MPDDLDYATEQRDEWLANRIAEHQYRIGHAVNAYESGKCRNCNDQVPDGHAFCCSECRIDWEQRLAAERRNGKYRGG